MPEVTIHTITPIHIGSGVKVFNKLDFFEDANHQEIHIADFEKIFQIVGSENIDRWTQAIEKNLDLMPILKARKPDVKPTDVALRSIPLFQKNLFNNKMFFYTLTAATERPCNRAAV